MLVLSRREGERIYIGDNIRVTVVENRGNKIRIGIECPLDIPICREEIMESIPPYFKELAAKHNDSQV